MKRRIIAANEGDSKLQDMVSDLKDDFDYILSGIERLDRTGSSGEALTLAEDMSSQFRMLVSEIADKIAE